MKFLILVCLMFFCSIPFCEAQNKTEQSYSAFCEKGAVDSMDKLNQNTKDLLGDIEAKRKNVNDLIAQKTIYSDLMKLKSDYYSALESVDNSRDLSRNEMKSNIDNFRNLLRTSLTMSVVKYMLKKAPNASAIKSTKDLCLNVEFKTTEICQNYGTTIFNNKDDRLMSKYLDSTLENLNNNISNLNDTSKNNTISNAQKLFETIPENIAPERIFQIISKNENLSQIITADDQSAIKDCLTNNDSTVNKCRQLMYQDEKTLSIISNEMEDAHKKIVSEKLHIFLEKEKTVSDTTTNDLKDRTNELKQSKLIDDILSKDESKKDEFKNFNLSDEEIQKYKSQCGNLNKQDIDLNECKDLNKKIYQFITDKNDEYTKSIEAKQNELNEAVDASKTRIATTERLKKFLSEKFTRSCKNTQQTLANSNLFCEISKLQNNNPSGDKEIKSLKDKVDEVVRKLIPDRQTMVGSEAPSFTKEEINQYVNDCNNSKDKNDKVPAIVSICNLVYAENQNMKNKMTDIESDKYNRDYIVEVNPNSKTGYTAKAKKSWIRAGGEAVAASIPQFYNTMLMNISLKYQIQELENQAMFQKQLSYMNDPNSPWMTTMPYFQSQFYNYGGGFDFQKYSNSKGFNFQN
jgi:hypothetical protein